MLVHIMGQFDAETKLLTQIGKHRRDGLKIDVVIEHLGLWPRIVGPSCHIGGEESSTTIGAQLTPDDRIAFLHVAPYVLFQFLHAMSARMSIARDGRAAGAAE